jgi:dipeptidyl-peptidase-4
VVHARRGALAIKWDESPSAKERAESVAFVKGGNVVVHDFKTKRSRLLTKGASESRFFGLAEFIAEEELDRHEGFWWSPDGAKLLILEVDESGVGIKVRPQIFADRTEMVSQRDPASGEKNAVVTAHVVDKKTGVRTTVKLPKTTQPVEYIARAGFLKDGTPYLQGLSRDQTTLWFFVVDKAGKATVLFEEQDSAWVEVHSNLRSFDDGALLWSTEQSGRNQLVRIDGKTGARTPLTTQPEAIADVVCAKDGRIVFSGFADRGRSVHLYERAADGAVRALTSGKSFHLASADGSCSRLLVTRSTWGIPPTTAPWWIRQFLPSRDPASTWLPLIIQVPSPNTVSCSTTAKASMRTFPATLASGWTEARGEITAYLSLVIIAVNRPSVTSFWPT